MYSSFKNTSFIAPDNFLYKITDLVGAGDIMDRSIAENNQLLTQLVSYTLILNPKSKKIFIAQRISGDERLQNSFCLGFGGHVSIEDFSLQFGSDPIRNAAIRELREELFIQNKNLDIKHLGFTRDLKSSTNEHLGIIFVMITGSARIRETDKLRGFWISYDELINEYYSLLESWSKHSFDYIYESPILSKKYGFAAE